MRRAVLLLSAHLRPAGVLACGAVLAVFLVSAPRAYGAPDAGEFLTELSDRAISQLTEPGVSSDEQKRRFSSLVSEGFDIPAIGRFVLGRYWRRSSEAQQQAFLAAFEDMIIYRFLPLFSEYSGDRLTFGVIRHYDKNPDFVSVASQFIRTEGEPININWRVRKHAGGYKIVDIVAEGISIAVTLRSEYNSVLKRNGGDVDALTQTLREKIAKL